MKNLKTYEDFIFEEVNFKEFDMIAESAIGLYRQLVTQNRDTMRSLFNIAKKQGYVLDGDVNFESMTPKEAGKLKETNWLKFWLDSRGDILLVTLGNFMMSQSFSANQKIQGRLLPYFYPSQMFGSEAAYLFVKGGGLPKIKGWLESEASSVLVIDLNNIQKASPSRDAQKIIDTYATKFGIPVLPFSIESIMDSKPAFVDRGDTVNLDSVKWDSYKVISTGTPSKSIDDKSLISLFRDFTKRLPSLRGSSKDTTNVSFLRKTQYPDSTKYELSIRYQDRHDLGISLMPNVAYVNSIIKSNGILPVESFYSEYFITLKFATAGSEKAAKMSTKNPHEALFNGHVNDAFKRALADAGPKVRAHANRIGDQTMLLWNDGDLEDDQYRKFFTDLTMYYAGAENLPGEPADVFSKGESQVIAF